MFDSVVSEEASVVSELALAEVAEPSVVTSPLSAVTPESVAPDGTSEVSPSGDPVTPSDDASVAPVSAGTPE